MKKRRVEGSSDRVYNHVYSGVQRESRLMREMKLYCSCVVSRKTTTKPSVDHHHFGGRVWLFRSFLSCFFTSAYLLPPIHSSYTDGQQWLYKEQHNKSLLLSRWFLNPFLGAICLIFHGSPYAVEANRITEKGTFCFLNLGYEAPNPWDYFVKRRHNLPAPSHQVFHPLSLIQFLRIL